MDILHHTAIGAIGSVALTASGHPVSGMAFLVASTLPDLDVLFMALGKRAYLKNHQGASHSLLVSPFLASLVGVPLMLFLWPDWRFFVFALLAVWLHILLDVCNTFGVAWLWPLSRRRDCLDAVFFIDLTAWLITGVALVTILMTRIPWVAVVYAVALAGYFVAKAYLQRNGRRRLGCTLAIPSGLHPLELLALDERGKGVRVYTVNVRSGEVRNKRRYEAVPQKYEAMAERSPVYRDMRRITRYLYITEVEERNDGEIAIVAHDLGVRNFGGKFGRTTLRFDKPGNLTHEMANV